MFGVGLPIKDYESLNPVTDKGNKLGKSQYHFIFQAAIAYLAGELEDSDFPRHDTSGRPGLCSQRGVVTACGVGGERIGAHRRVIGSRCTDKAMQRGQRASGRDLENRAPAVAAFGSGPVEVPVDGLHQPCFRDFAVSAVETVLMAPTLTKG